MGDLTPDKSTIVRSFAERLFPVPFRLRGPAEAPVARSLESPPAVPGYPWELIRSLRLDDGGTVRLRPIRPDDEPRLVELFHRLSPRTVYQRFFRAYDRLPQHWYRHFANVDYRARLALVAEEPGAGARLRAVACYEPGETSGITEVAIVVEDAWQGRGLGTLLLDALLAAAEARDQHRFTADVLADNRPMLRVLSRLADVRRRELDDGVLTIEFERRRRDKDDVKKGDHLMSKIMGTTVMLASVSLLLVGGCATTGVGDIPGNVPSASPSSSEPQPQFYGPRDPNQIPQTL